MKISPYIIYLEMQPNALLLRQNFIIRKKVGVTVLLTSTVWCVLHITTHRNSISINWLPVHHHIRISCLELWHPARATIVVKLVTSFEIVLY
jgi:hypothetical protein